ncbi:TetR/AcrR family transcriptional regulator [Chryseobacterium scophthalmum]|uniref:TetR/AcrR family transcriptional regulator n=1 Tax=Chryseobacterium scophthalmum TaxID=59733 RepID=UPI003D00C9EA
MGRHTKFDRETAVKKALNCFWKNGYHKTSLEDLLREMKLSLSSFYNSFVSKEKLFFETIKYYREQIGAIRLKILLDNENDGISALRFYFNHVLLQNGEGFPSGCYMTKTAAGVLPNDLLIMQEVKLAITNLENAFAVAIERGILSNKIKKSYNSSIWSKILLNQVYGVSVLTNNIKSPEDLLQLCYTVLDQFELR